MLFFFGTPPFAAQVLDYLLQHDVQIVAVISKPDRPKGRSGTPVATAVKEAALRFDPSLPIYQPEIVSAPDFAQTLTPYQADLFVVVAYGEILKTHLLEMPKRACINLHTSLLPRYRGAAPIQRCLIEGEIETGVTIMHMVKKMDAGDVIKQVNVPIGPEMTFGELEERLCHVGKEVLLEVIRAFERGDPPRLPQDDSLATFAPKIELEDCQIAWNRPAQQVHNLIRGVNPYPGAWCDVTVKGEKKRLKIHKSRVIPLGQDLSPGTIVNLQQTKGNLIIATAQEALELLDVQLEGKRSMSSEELCRGIARSHLSFS